MAWKKIIKVLEKNGWEIIRKRGSHCRWVHKETGRHNTTCFAEGSLEKNRMRVIEKSFGVKLK